MCKTLYVTRLVCKVSTQRCGLGVQRAHTFEWRAWCAQSVANRHRHTCTLTTIYIVQARLYPHNYLYSHHLHTCTPVLSQLPLLSQLPVLSPPTGTPVLSPPHNHLYPHNYLYSQPLHTESLYSHSLHTIGRCSGCCVMRPLT